MTTSTPINPDEDWTVVVGNLLSASLGQWRLEFAPRAGFWFLRHGRTAENLKGVCQGHADVPLDDCGRDQARAAGLQLKGTKLRSIVSSDLKRAHETAVLAALESGGPPPVLDAQLRERSFGSHEGVATPAAAWFDRESYSEPIEAFTRRTLRAIEGAVDGPDVLICSHGGCLRVLAAALNVSLDRSCYGNAIPLRFEPDGHGWSCFALK